MESKIPILTLVHSVSTLIEPVVCSWRDLRRCDPSECLLDARFEGVSIFTLGARLSDPTRIVDVYTLERLVRASTFGIAIPLHRACDTMTDPASFVFAEDLMRRGHEQFSRDALKNGVKRLRAVFNLVHPGPTNWLIRYEGSRGYLFDFSHAVVEVLHIPQ